MIHVKQELFENKKKNNSEDGFVCFEEKENIVKKKFPSCHQIVL